jgi:hypothetical protein
MGFGGPGGAPPPATPGMARHVVEKCNLARFQ